MANEQYSDAEFAQFQQRKAYAAAQSPVTPDQGASALKLAPQLDLPPSVVMAAPDQAKAQAEAQTQQHVIANSPAVAGWAASGDPASVAASKDDFHNLAKVADLSASWTAHPFDAFMQALMPARADTAAGRLNLTAGQYAAQFGPLGDVAQGAKQANLATDAAIAERKAAFAKGDLLGSAVATGKEVLASLGIGGSIFAPITQLLARGLEASDRVTAPGPVSNIASMFLDPRSVASYLAKTHEEHAADNEQLANLALMAEGVIGGSGAPKGSRPVAPAGGSEPMVPRIGTHPDVDGLRTAAAQADAAAATHMQETIASSATHSRSPEAMEQFLAQQPGERPVSVDPDVLTKLAGEGHEVFPGMEQEITNAAVSGEQVELPLSKYLANTAGKPFAEELNGATVFREGGVAVNDDTGASTQSVPTGQSTEPLTEGETPRAQYLAEDTRAQMEQVVKAQFLEPLFKDPSAIGMTEAQFARYNSKIEDAIGEASDKALAQAYNQIKRERTPQWKEAVAQHSGAVEKELATHPAVQARSYLALGKGPLGEPIERPFKLASDDPIAQHGKDLGLPDRMFSKSGISADEAGEVFGYPSGADMVRDLANLQHEQGDLTIAQHMKAMVKEEAEARARKQLGFGTTAEEMYNKASELVNSPKVTDFLADELKQLAKLANLPFNKMAVKAYASLRFDKLPVATALNLRKMEGYVYKGGVKAEKALLKGDFATAFIRKQQQFIHHLQLAEAHKFAKFYAKSQRQWSKVARKLAVEGLSSDALYWSKAVLAESGRVVKANPEDLARPIGGHMDLSSFIRAKNDMGADIAHAPVPPPVNGENDLSKWTVDQYTGVAQMVQSILRWGSGENQLTVDGVKRALQEMVDEGIASLARYTRTITDAEIQHPNLAQSIDRARRVVDSWLVRQEQLLRDFGGRDPRSPFHQVVTRRIQERKAWAQDVRLELAKDFGALAQRNPKFNNWLKARLPTGGPLEQFKSTDGSPLFVTNNEVMMAALHMGDTEAFDKFVRGYGIDDPNALRTAVAHQMTPAGWDVAQTIWDSFGKLTPEITAMYKRINGYSPKLVEATPFKLPDGTVVKGGYFPIMYDFGKAPKEWLQQQNANTMLGSPHYVRATPTNSYIEQRTGFAAPMQLRFANVYARMNQQIHDIAFREALADAHKFLLHPDMVNAIRHKYGPEYVDKLRQDLKDIAGAESINPIDNNIGKAIDWMSEGQMIDMIGFSTSTMLKHGLTAQFQAPPEVGLGRYLSWMQKVRLSPGKWTKQAMAESPEVRHVISNLSEDAYRQFLALQKGKPGWNKQITSFAFHLVGASNKFVAVPLYHAAKEMVSAKYPGMDEAGVQSAANAILRQALGSSGKTDAPIALRFGGDLVSRVIRLSNPFMTFFSHMYNKQREIPQSLGYAGEKVNIGRAMGIAMASIIAPIAIEETIRKKGMEGLGLLGTLAEGITHQQLAGVPVAGPFTAAAIKQFDKSYPGGTDALQSMGENAGKTIKNIVDTVKHGKHWTGTKTRQALIAAGPFAHIPGVALGRFEKFIEDMFNSAGWDTAVRDLTGWNPPPEPNHRRRK